MNVIVQEEDVILHTTLEQLDACQPSPLVVFMNIHCWLQATHHSQYSQESQQLTDAFVTLAGAV